MDPTNVLVIMSDEHNARMLGLEDGSIAKTPHLDELARGGTRFTNAYTNCPICVPARASFATGRYINDIEYWDNSIAYDGRVPSWGHRLQAAKRRVESVGKLHYQDATANSGFDKQNIPLHIAEGLGMVHLSIRNQFSESGFGRTSRKSIAAKAGVGESEYTRYDRRIADVACGLIGNCSNEHDPWVIFVSFVCPHYPLVAPEEFYSMYDLADLPEPKFAAGSGYEHHPWLENFALGPDASLPAIEHKKALRSYLALCSFVDAQVGRVIEALRASGQFDTTRIIYTSDHGENAGARGLWGKSNLYEEAARIPLIMSGPNIPAGHVCNTPVTLVDAYPTILDAAGVPLGRDDVRDDVPGRSLLEVANNPDEPERVAFSEYHAAGSPSAAFMIRRGPFKYIHYVGFEPELFDLETDPEEGINLAQDPAYQAVLRDLHNELRAIVDPDDADRRANNAQRELIERLGGPEKVLARLVTEKNYTPIPDNLLS